MQGDEQTTLRAKKAAGTLPEERPAASHTGYPEPGDSLPLFFFPQPPHGLMHPR